MEHYKSLFNSTDSNIQLQNYHLLNPNYELIFNRQSRFLGAFSSKSKTSYLRQPTTPSSNAPTYWCAKEWPYNLAMNYLTFNTCIAFPSSCGTLTKQAAELDNDMCGSSKSQLHCWNTQNSPGCLRVLQSTGVAAVQLKGQRAVCDCSPSLQGHMLFWGLFVC